MKGLCAFDLHAHSEHHNLHRHVRFLRFLTLIFKKYFHIMTTLHRLVFTLSNAGLTIQAIMDIYVYLNLCLLFFFFDHSAFCWARECGK